MFYVVSLVGSLQFQDTMWKCGNDGGDDDDVSLCMLVGYVSQSFIDMNILDGLGCSEWGVFISKQFLPSGT